MDDWLHAAVDTAVLVTVAFAEGSAPREAGARMLVDGSRQWDTIGGGHLELRAVRIARAMLDAGEERRLERFPLGPSLGQCCGGVVHLAFERVDAGYLAALAQQRGADCWRLVALDGAPERTLHAQAPAGVHGGGTRLLRDAAGRRWLADLVAAPRHHLMLFGAGHVGAAIVRVLADLPCRVTWVDEREDAFPSDAPPNVRVEATDVPEALAARAPAGTGFLVMTHSHALDQRLAETILKRADPGWFGLIGSDTKRRQFERRLLERGVDRARLDAMACPVGVPGIDGKQPAVVAVAVAAQLLAVWEREDAGDGARVPDASHESPGRT
ncbi:xanthine dehydrogenase accessory protein XdhC [uncultured Massilia sp.]|uniref:xanthine dehydrogenase accessory protein XdhC n=1 Tax=uncultured Massilia sp. TaxID=169973 RepID=UPI0025F836C4|nr:xanthine dehydrogenase accessory protein XdhC [uncultured Massilia sp.]